MPATIGPELRETIRTLRAQGTPLRQISRLLRLSRNTVRRILRASPTTPHDESADPHPPCPPETLALIEKARAGMALDLDCYPYTASSTVLLPDFVEGAERVLITWSESHPERTGQDLSAIAAEWGCSRLEAAERYGEGQLDWI